ncbi:MAG TPA: RsmB/NOP family class I SAM-dependent RNA methyltransferase, partial [Candidatus Bathyarchaeia archaeon]|nr:RsmB/NOP family class I SAM-dependent RNA methyltransferase [Candidatus Bathyarchaeia archaeon]
MNRREKCLANLAALIVLEEGRPSPGTVDCLRVLSPDGFRRDLEYLLGIAQTYEPLPMIDAGKDKDRTVRETHNRPWWVNYCIRTFGRGRGVKLLSSYSRPRYIRVNSLRTNGDLTLPQEAEGLERVLEAVPLVPGVFRVGKSPPSLSHLLSSGLLQFQDLASYCAAVAAGPKPGEGVLDLCSAPGAKTSALAQLMRNSGEIVSVDYSASRMKSWTREMKRLGVEIAFPVIGDASRLGLTGHYELVLLDPPCSGTGILDRNPEMKLRLNQESVTRYSQLQTMMLEEAYRLLSPNGRILYSTCSLTLEENEQVISAFLRAHSEMETVALPLS